MTIFNVHQSLSTSESYLLEFIIDKKLLSFAHKIMKVN